MYTSVGALGWSVGRGQPLVETTCYKQSLPLEFYFHSIFSLNLWFWWGEKECLTLQKLQTTFCERITAMIWGEEFTGEKNPSRREMWCLSHHHATLVYCFAVACISETLLLLKRIHCTWIVLHHPTPHPKKILNRSKQSFIAEAI